MFRTFRLAACSALALVCSSISPLTQAQTNCDRSCMADLVNRVTDSMTAHNPDALPLAIVYRATENSHPAALGMMTLWRSITKAHRPEFVAIDTARAQAYFEGQINEGDDLSVLWGRIKVVNRKIAELELFVNRSRGDHGFSFSADKLPENLRPWMNPPLNRNRATRAELEALARIAFANEDKFPYQAAPDCSFIEAGSKVVDPGLDDVPPVAAPTGSSAMDPNAPIGCATPAQRPLDAHSRPLVIDEELGIVVVGAIIPGTVFPYPFCGHMMSAFIPSQMTQPAEMQRQWLARKLAQQKGPLLEPTDATGDTMEIYQIYDSQVHGHQINVHLGPAGFKSPWLK
jgi:hypothetical protein